ncbi:MAG: phospho-N-acetylmuramoyl-pentapeptide-transferase [Campylobacteraceae bacterium]|jgi:phospho-N-acetylmuramoyl-pentapeptide-transferase|nr:phospho-N-acetylmuramoyl-pentapeptide-transferase [Campylobacteraceae bacterium]
MFYWISQYFSINLLQYITVRASLGFFLAFVFTVGILPYFIKWAKRKKANQPIYTLAPKTHQNKNNTPTMGGLFFLTTALLAIFICARLDNVYVLISILCIVGFGVVGIKDDLSKINFKSNTKGLSAKAKAFALTVVGLIISSLTLYYSGVGSELYVPFYKFPLFNLGYFSIFFWTLVLLASSNAVNLTDGLDGLATVPSIFSLLTLGIFIYLSGHAVLSAYLLLPKIMGTGEVVIVAASLIGSLMGFLWYNCYPAEVFMGDTGSLSVGAIIGYMAIISKNELLLFLIGFVFVLETLSVILQVGSFKTRKKRIFLMAPIHHHFEIKGWAENKIIVRFWIIALLSNLIALTALKIR